MKIAFGNGIFACKPMFSYGQRSECADLLNSYKSSIICVSENRRVKECIMDKKKKIMAGAGAAVIILAGAAFFLGGKAQKADREVPEVWEVLVA